MTMGRLIPAGTGFEYYRNVRIPADESPRRSCEAAHGRSRRRRRRPRAKRSGAKGPPTILEEELELEREMEYFVEPEEAFTRDEIE